MKAHRGSTGIAVSKGYWFSFTPRQLYPRERTKLATEYYTVIPRLMSDLANEFFG